MCTDQRKYTQSLIDDGAYIVGLGKVIDAIMERADKCKTGKISDCISQVMEDFSFLRLLAARQTAMTQHL
jgi:hypothetical protein